MGKKIRIGSTFIAMTEPEEAPHLRNVYWGSRDGTNAHAHLCLSGSVSIGPVVSAETWYARTPNGLELVKNGSGLMENTSQLLSDCMPNTLKEFQHPEKPLFWNVGSLDSFFLSQRKRLQQ